MGRVEFVSYNGIFPNLCFGELVLRIDGEEYHSWDCMRPGGCVRLGLPWMTVLM